MTKPLGGDEWWDYTWSPVGGCSPISPGCTLCYAPRILQSYAQGWRPGAVHHQNAVDLTQHPPVFTRQMTAAPDGHKEWIAPSKWPGVKHPKLGVGKPSLIFVVDMGDLFHEDRPTEQIDRVITGIVASKHIGLLLTKRPARMAAYFAAQPPSTLRLWRTKLWLGFSAERQREFDRRWTDMRTTHDPGWIIFVSVAPMIGPVTLPPDFLALGGRGWVIVAGDQGPHKLCRDMHPDWARAVRDQCRAAGIPFFMKQMAKKAPIPPDLQIRQFPAWPPNK